ncbi:hypothetical protein M9H77_36192 [Catharanthus roseus]|uniref:Uncharacterized protein n=1 Tax=Catharanthus roseus TaxID=4058 RepID=A0ACB9ZTC1_CATRO|nr:hypothetical protein M9H77_36192 [Catharanthus roseus]
MPPPSDTEPYGSTGRKRSFVWNVFDKYPNSKTRFKICKKEFTDKKNDGTDSVKRHIEHVHPSHYADLTTQTQFSDSASAFENPIAHFNYDSDLVRREIVRESETGSSSQGPSQYAEMPSSSSSSQGGFGYMMNIYDLCTVSSSSSMRTTLSELENQEGLEKASPILHTLKKNLDFQATPTMELAPQGRNKILEIRLGLLNRRFKKFLALNYMMETLHLQ